MLALKDEPNKLQSQIKDNTDSMRNNLDNTEKMRRSLESKSISNETNIVDAFFDNWVTPSIEARRVANNTTFRRPQQQINEVEGKVNPEKWGAFGAIGGTAAAMTTGFGTQTATAALMSAGIGKGLLATTVGVVAPISLPMLAVGAAVGVGAMMSAPAIQKISNEVIKQIGNVGAATLRAGGSLIQLGFAAIGKGAYNAYKALSTSQTKGVEKSEQKIKDKNRENPELARREALFAQILEKPNPDFSKLYSLQIPSQKARDMLNDKFANHLIMQNAMKNQDSRAILKDIQKEVGTFAKENKLSKTERKGLESSISRNIEAKKDVFEIDRNNVVLGAKEAKEKVAKKDIEGKKEKNMEMSQYEARVQGKIKDAITKKDIQFDKSNEAEKHIPATPKQNKYISALVKKTPENKSIEGYRKLENPSIADASRLINALTKIESKQNAKNENQKTNIKSEQKTRGNQEQKQQKQQKQQQKQQQQKQQQERERDNHLGNERGGK